LLRLEPVRWWKKGVLLAALTVTGAFVLYLIGINLILRTRILRSALNGAQHDIVVDYEQAYSLWPGGAHVSGLTIRGEDDNVQWWLRIDSCDFHVALADFRRRRFHATRVRAEGLTLRARLKFTEAAPEHIAALPLVPGFGPLPVRLPAPPSPPPTDREYHLWSVQLDDVDVVHVSEVWVDVLRFAGDMRVRGRWLFRPVRLLDVGPAVIDGLHSVSYGQTALISELSGPIYATIHPLDIRPPGPPEFVRHASASTDVVGRLHVSAVADVLALRAGLRISSEDGTLRLASVIDHGTLRPGTRASLVVPSAEAEEFGASLIGSVAADLRVEQPPGESPTVNSNVELRGLRLLKARAAATLQLLSAQLRSQQLDLVAPFGDVAWTAAFSGLASDDLGSWGEQVPGDYRIRAGALRADAALRGSVSEGQISGNVALALPGVVVGKDREEWSGDVRAALNIGSASFESGRIQFGASRATVAYPALRAAGVGASAKSASIDVGSLVLEGAKLRVATAQADMSHLVVRTRGMDARGDVSATIRVGTPPGSGTAVVSFGELAVSNVRLCDSRAAQLEQCAIAPRVEVRVRDLSRATRGGGLHGTLGIRIPHADVSVPSQLLSILPSGLRADHGRGIAALRAEVDLASMTGSGEADVRMDEIRLQAGSHVALGAAMVQVRARGRGDGYTDLSGSSIRLFGWRLGANDEWWGDVELENGAVRASADAELRAAIHISARDASPLVAIVAATTAVPEWLAKIPSTTGLQGDGELLLGKSSMTLQSVYVRGGDVRMRLAYTKGPNESRGGLLFGFGPLSAGFGLGGGEPSFVLIGAEQWFDSVAARLLKPARR